VEPPLDDDGVIRPLTDSARVVQFLRYYAGSLDIDPEQVAVYGASAGASTSLWLGTHDDLADPGNEDPVLRESSRVNAVGALPGSRFSVPWCSHWLRFSGALTYLPWPRRWARPICC
jgi:hypothetical protein